MKRPVRIIASTCAALLLLLAGTALAQTMTQAGDSDYHVPKSIEDAIGQLEKAQGDVDRVRKIGGDTTEARRQVDTAEKNVEEARVKALSQESGLSEAKIREMRASGKGWGVIAKDAGVHPGTLGVGNGNKGPKGKGKGGAADDGDTPGKGKKDKKKDQDRKGHDDDDQGGKDKGSKDKGQKDKGKKDKGKKKVDDDDDDMSGKGKGKGKK